MQKQVDLNSLSVCQQLSLIMNSFAMIISFSLDHNNHDLWLQTIKQGIRHLTSPYLSSSVSLIYNNGARCSSNCLLKKLSWAVYEQCSTTFLHVYHCSFKKHLFYSSKAINKYQQVILCQQQQLNNFNIQPCPLPSEIQSEVASHGAVRGSKCSYTRGKH